MQSISNEVSVSPIPCILHWNRISPNLIFGFLKALLLTLQPEVLQKLCNRIRKKHEILVLTESFIVFQSSLIERKYRNILLRNFRPIRYVITD